MPGHTRGDLLHRYCIFIKHRHLNVMFNKVVDSVFECTRLKLFFEVDHYHDALVVVIVLETEHGKSQQYNHI